MVNCTDGRSCMQKAGSEGGHTRYSDKVSSWQRNEQQQRWHWVDLLGLASVCSLFPAFFHYDFAYKKSVLGVKSHFPLLLLHSSKEALSRVCNDILRFSGWAWHFFRSQECRRCIMWSQRWFMDSQPFICDDTRGRSSHMGCTPFIGLLSLCDIPSCHTGTPPILFHRRKCSRMQVSTALYRNHLSSCHWDILLQTWVI